MEAFMGEDCLKEKSPDREKENKKLEVKINEEDKEKGENLAREIVEFLWKIIVDGKTNKTNAQMVSNVN